MQKARYSRALIESDTLEQAIHDAAEKGGDPEKLRNARNMIRKLTHVTRGTVHTIMHMIEDALNQKRVDEAHTL